MSHKSVRQEHFVRECPAKKCLQECPTRVRVSNNAWPLVFERVCAFGFVCSIMAPSCFLHVIPGVENCQLLLLASFGELGSFGSCAPSWLHLVSSRNSGGRDLPAVDACFLQRAWVISTIVYRKEASSPVFTPQFEPPSVK